MTEEQMVQHAKVKYLFRYATLTKLMTLTLCTAVASLFLRYANVVGIVIYLAVNAFVLTKYILLLKSETPKNEISTLNKISLQEIDLCKLFYDYYRTSALFGLSTGINILNIYVVLSGKNVTVLLATLAFMILYPLFSLIWVSDVKSIQLSFNEQKHAIVYRGKRLYKHTERLEF